MSSLWNRYRKLNNRKKKPSPILHEEMKESGPARGRKKLLCIKRIPLPASLQIHVQCSMTLEAALIVPLMLFFFLNLMSAIEMLRLHGNLEMALWENGRMMAVGGYVYDQTSLAESDNLILRLGGTALTDWAVHNAVCDQLGDAYLESTPLTHGAEGLNFMESSYMKEDCIDIKVTYQVSPMFQIPGFTSFRMANRFFARAWTGYQVYEEEAKEDIVYVTTYGEVYHFDINCSYLKRIVQAMSLAEAMVRKNQKGEHYTMCQLCEKKQMEEQVYLTPDGNRYHHSLECPALKRLIRSMELSQAKQRYRECSRCGR